MDPRATGVRICNLAVPGRQLKNEKRATVGMLAHSTMNDCGGNFCTVNLTSVTFVAQLEPITAKI